MLLFGMNLLLRICVGTGILLVIVFTNGCISVGTKNVVAEEGENIGEVKVGETFLLQEDHYLINQNRGSTIRKDINDGSIINEYKFDDDHHPPLSLMNKSGETLIETDRFDGKKVKYVFSERKRTHYRSLYYYFFVDEIKSGTVIKVKKIISRVGWGPPIGFGSGSEVIGSAGKYDNVNISNLFGHDPIKPVEHYLKKTSGDPDKN